MFKFVKNWLCPKEVKQALFLESNATLSDVLSVIYKLQQISCSFFEVTDGKRNGLCTAYVGQYLIFWHTGKRETVANLEEAGIRKGRKNPKSKSLTQSKS